MGEAFQTVAQEQLADIGTSGRLTCRVSQVRLLTPARRQIRAPHNVMENDAVAT
jgi:hypothetical protein